MEFLAGPDSDAPHITSRSDCLRHIDQFHAGDLRHENLSAAHLFKAANHKPHSLFEGDPKTSHAGIGNGDLSQLSLLQKHGNNAATASHNIAVTGTAETSVTGTGISIRLHE